MLRIALLKAQKNTSRTLSHFNIRSKTIIYKQDLSIYSDQIRGESEVKYHSYLQNSVAFFNYKSNVWFSFPFCFYKKKWVLDFNYDEIVLLSFNQNSLKCLEHFNFGNLPLFVSFPFPSQS